MPGTQIPAGTRELTAGQLSARSGVAVSALHFYEAQGLISARRTTGNQRRYPREMLRRVAFIRASQRVGIPLAGIRASLDTCIGCGCLSITACQLTNPDDILGNDGPGPRRV